MPINRIPNVHRFGIISQSQRAELEERIAQKALSEAQHKISSQQAISRPLPFEVTEDFVYKFNDSSQEERKQLEDTAFKMLERLKRLCGLRDAGEVQHGDLPRAWVDLALLAQCRSAKLEDACLETLIASLDQASVSKDHILSLFYLAKSGIHWLKRYSNQTVLRSAEIKLLQMTRLVFFRLYCHYLLGQLQEYESQQSSLTQYLKGFSERENFYSQFPGVQLSFRFIVESGYAICASPKSVTCQDCSPTEQTGISEKPLHEVQIVDAQDAASVYRSHFVKDNTEGPSCTNFTFLWHSINVWYAVNNDTFRVDDALFGVFQNTSHLANEPWLDIVFAFYILADACRHNVRVLNAFQYLISLDFSTASVPVDVLPLCETCYSSLSSTREKKIHNSNLTTEDSPSCNVGSEYRDSNSSADILEKLNTFMDCSWKPGDTNNYLRTPQDTNQQQNIPTSGGNARQENTMSSCSWEDEGYLGTDKHVNAVLQACGNIGKDVRDPYNAKDIGNVGILGTVRDVNVSKDIRSERREKGGSSKKTNVMANRGDFCDTYNTQDAVERKRNTLVNENLLNGQTVKQFNIDERSVPLTSVGENGQGSRIPMNENYLSSLLTRKQQGTKMCPNSTPTKTIVENSDCIRGNENNFSDRLTEDEHDTQNRIVKSTLGGNVAENHQIQSGKVDFSSKLAAGQYDTLIKENGGSQTTKAERKNRNAAYLNTNLLETQKANHLWPWELVYAFCECMTSICLHGVSSRIQKTALLGDETKRSSTERYGNSVNSLCGLVDFLEFGKDQNQDGWRIRYAAVQGLVRVSNHHYGDTTKEGLAHVAWSSLMYCETSERDGRVLDAIKVGKVEADLENKLAKEHIPVSLWTSRIAAVLSQISHPQSLPGCAAASAPPSSSSTASLVNKFTGKSVKAVRGSGAKASLRQEIRLSNACHPTRVGYGERMNLELRSVIEDQWKKQLLDEMEEELKTNVSELNEKETQNY